MFPFWMYIYTDCYLHYLLFLFLSKWASLQVDGMVVTLTLTTLQQLRFSLSLVCACMSVGLSVCLYVCMYVRLFVCTFVRLYELGL